MTTFVYGEWRCIILIFRLLLVSQWGFEGIREFFSLSHDDPSGEIFCPIGLKKSNVKVNLDLWETQHTHVIMLIMTIHNFQFFISPLEMGKKEIFITAVCNMSFMLLRNAIRLPGSGPKGLEEEQIFWFGHPWQAVPFPACSLPVPGQSVKIEKNKLSQIKKISMVNFSDRAEKMEKYIKSYVQEHSPERPPYCMSQRACD